jgi:hypothetical protein
LAPLPNSIDAQIAVLKSWGRTPDRAARTAPARDAQMARFLREVIAEFPDADDQAVAQMADARMRAHFKLMAKRSGEARRARKAAGGDEAA